MLAPIAILALALADPPPKPVSFRADVAPILVAKCLGCHDDRKAANGLNMRTLALIRKGGKAAGDETIVAGDPDASHLVEVLRPDAEPRMPLKLPPLADAEVATIARWIAEGATSDAGPEATTTLRSLVDPLRDLPKIAVKVPVSDPATALAYTKDGATLAAAVGKSVILFDLKAGKPAATLADHPGPVSAVAVSPDGKTLFASGGRAGQFGFVAAWDLATKARRYEVRGHGDAILAADLSPDGKTLATASYDRSVRLWDAATGREVRTLKEHTDAVHAVAFSPDGSRVATGGADRTVKVWDPTTGRRVVSFSDSTGEVYAVAFGAGGSTVYAGGVDRSIRSWTLSATGGVPAKSAFAHEAPVIRLAVSPDGKALVSTGEDRRVEVWSLPGLGPVASLGTQSDWPLAVAVSPDGGRVAVGRYDGSIGVFDLKTGGPVVALREAPKPAPMSPKPKPQLAKNASLNPPSPRGGVRGSTVRVALTGNGVGNTAGVYLDEPTLSATIVPVKTPDPNRLEVDLTIAAGATPGPHRLSVQTPIGVPPAVVFVVSEHPETAEAEPNDDPAKVTKTVGLPTTLVGNVDKPGDADAWRFEAKAGDDLVFAATARGMGSTLDAVLTLLDLDGRPIARAAPSPTEPDPVLTARIARDGVVTLVVSDAQHGGSGNHAYRVVAGRLPRLTATFPLVVATGPPAVLLPSGANLGDDGGVLSIDTKGLPAGSVVPIRVGPGGRRLVSSRSVVVAEGRIVVEAEPDDTPAKAVAVDHPGGASGVILKGGDVDVYKFRAKKGERLIVEVFGRRLGSPIDPVVEILDEAGRPVPRAILRPVSETNVAFRDHPSTGRNIRLTKWDDLAIGDHLLVGRELMRLAALPRNPDDDAIMWGLGNERTDPGERVALLETTPEHHPLNQPMLKVEIHPPGATFPSGGMAPVALPFKNDDGGPGLGKDARVTFDPPSDGTYLARVEDVRGLGGPDFGYGLVVRLPRPDFAVGLSTDDPNIPRGGSAIVRVNLTRIDGFEGAVDVSVEGLPPGVVATAARVESETYTADLLLSADASAPAVSPPTWRLVARSVPSSGGESIRHEIDPGGLSRGQITITPETDIKVRGPDRVVIRPGGRVDLTLKVERGPAFSGRVPIDVRNLPPGVRVLNIGLNGVLVTESQTARTISLYAEPWARPGVRPCFAVGRVEATASDASSPPILLEVRPASTTASSSASARP